MRLAIEYEAGKVKVMAKIEKAFFIIATVKKVFEYVSYLKEV